MTLTHSRITTTTTLRMASMLPSPMICQQKRNMCLRSFHLQGKRRSNARRWASAVGSCPSALAVYSQNTHTHTHTHTHTYTHTHTNTRTHTHTHTHAPVPMLFFYVPLDTHLCRMNLCQRTTPTLMASPKMRPFTSTMKRGQFVIFLLGCLFFDLIF